MKTKHLFEAVLGVGPPVLDVTKTGLVCLLIIFQDRLTFSLINQSSLGESFLLMWLNMGLCLKINKIRYAPVLF